MLSKARKNLDGNFELVMTYRDGKNNLGNDLHQFFEEEKQFGRTYSHRAIGERDSDPAHPEDSEKKISTAVNLLNPINF